MSEQWEDIETPRGTFIGWGEVGQTVIVEAVTYGDTAGSDFNGNQCPQLVGVLEVDAINYRKGVKETVSKGEFVIIKGDKASLASGLRAADITPGILVRVKFDDTYKTTKGSDGKAFKVSVNRAKRGVDADELV